MLGKGHRDLYKAPTKEERKRKAKRRERSDQYVAFFLFYISLYLYFILVRYYLLAMEYSNLLLLTHNMILTSTASATGLHREVPKLRDARPRCDRFSVGNADAILQRLLVLNFWILKLKNFFSVLRCAGSMLAPKHSPGNVPRISCVTELPSSRNTVLMHQPRVEMHEISEVVDGIHAEIVVS